MIFFKIINVVCLSIFILLNVFALKSDAFLVANPNLCYDTTKEAFGLGYEFGHRKVFEKNNISNLLPSKLINKKKNLLFVERYLKLIKELSLFVRFGTAEQEESNLNGNFGAQISFIADKLSVNITLSRKLVNGEDQLAIWHSYRIKRNIYLYGGISKSSQTSSDYTLYKESGGFFGVKYTGSNHYNGLSIAGEFHVINEYTSIFSFGYVF